MDSIADDNTFSELYRKYYGMAFGIAFRILRNVEDAEDVAQDSFERVYGSIDGFKENADFKTWLYAIVKNKSIDFIRRRKTKNCREEVDVLPHYTPGPEMVCMQKEIEALISDAVNKLSPKLRIILRLRIRGMTYREISDMLHRPMGSVAASIYYARKEIEQMLKSLVFN